MRKLISVYKGPAKDFKPETGTLTFWFEQEDGERVTWVTKHPDTGETLIAFSMDEAERIAAKLNLRAQCI